MLKWLKHLFDDYKIYKINDEWFAVREGHLTGYWIDRDGKETWCAKRSLLANCLVSSCEEAYDVIKRRKEFIGKISPKIKFADECYKD